VAAAADYARGEAWRLLGRSDEAERAYRAAEQVGHDPMPGLAWLRLDQDRAPEAAAAVGRAVAMADDPLIEARLLPAAVQAFLAAQEPAGGAATDAASARLRDLSRGWPTTGFRAADRQAAGEVALARGDAAAAASALEEARRCWLSQEAPYEAARVRHLLGQACALLGDVDAGAAHRSAAASELASLRARAAGPPSDEGKLGLSPRETQVLRLVAAGLTNRDVSRRLVLSERTIDRHVSNILAKLGVSTRTAAAAQAHQHGLA
jgi:DNA-binding CsgD family transcriptional regulator